MGLVTRKNKHRVRGWELSALPPQPSSGEGKEREIEL